MSQVAVPRDMCQVACVTCASELKRSLNAMPSGLADLFNGQAPCRRLPKVDFGESISETGSLGLWLENCGSEIRFWMNK